MTPQFTLGSLLAFILFCAVLLSLLSIPVQPMLGIGGLTFWLVLLAPFWIPQFFMTREARKRQNVRPWLALIAGAWYWILILVVHLARADILPVSWSKAGAVAGTLGACSALLCTRRVWWYVLIAPLAFAIVSGTVCFLLA